MDVLKVLGADVRLVPAVPIADLKNYNHKVRSVFLVCSPSKVITKSYFSYILRYIYGLN